MSSGSSNITQTAKTESSIHSQTLEDEEVREAVYLFRTVVFSSRGPHGKIKMIQNSIGGHLTLTSTSCRLLSVMSFTKPVLHLLVSAAQGHLSHQSDGGLLLLLMSLSLIEKSLRIQINYKFLTEVFEEFLDMAVDVFEKQNKLKLNFKITDVKHISNLTDSVLTSKPLCKLRGKTLTILRNLVIEAFLKTLHIDMRTQQLSSDQIYIITMEGKSAAESCLYDGLIIDTPEIPPYAGHILDKYYHKGEVVSVALITVSMSGDSDEHLKGTYHVSPGVSANDVVLDKILTFCDKLIGMDVKLILCQKVIHPRIKLYLRKRNVFSIERLGLQPINYVRDLTGAVPFLSFAEPKKDHIGRLSPVELMVLGGKSYLHLRNPDCPILTFCLCSPQEEAVSELKVLVQTALSTLKEGLSDLYVLPGGGCWQVYLAAILRQMVHSQMSELQRNLQCSKSVLLMACKVFTDSLQTVAMSTAEEGESHLTCKSNPHYWRVPGVDETLPTSDLLTCSCGQITKSFGELQFLEECDVECPLSDPLLENFDPEISDKQMVLDSYKCNISSLKTAVLSANAVLSIGQFIDDRN